MTTSKIDLSEGAVVGLPRALLFYELYPFWRALLEDMGLRVVVSRQTSRETVEAGSRRAADEACLPVKAFYGHVTDLKNRVDAIFLPRLVSLARGTFTCPKMLGLPDMVRHNIPGLPRVIVADFDETKRGRTLAEAGHDLALRVTRSGRRALSAASAGVRALQAFREGLWSGRGFEAAAAAALEGPGQGAGRGGPDRPDVRARAEGAGGDGGGPAPGGKVVVGVVGHAYNIFDSGVNLGLLRRLEHLGCQVITSERLSDDEVRAESARLPKEIFWSSGRRILAAVTKMRRENVVDGLVHVVSFACGPDSIVGEIAERETRRGSDLPFMGLTIDEHTAEAGLVTRLEAFVDMLQRRRRASPGRWPAEVTA